MRTLVKKSIQEVAQHILLVRGCEETEIAYLFKARL